MYKDIKDELVNLESISDLVCEDINKLTSKYIENGTPVIEVLNAYLQNSIELAFLINSSSEQAIHMIEEHITNSYPLGKKHIH